MANFLNLQSWWLPCYDALHLQTMSQNKPSCLTSFEPCVAFTPKGSLYLCLCCGCSQNAFFLPYRSLTIVSSSSGELLLAHPSPLPPPPTIVLHLWIYPLWLTLPFGRETALLPSSWEPWVQAKAWHMVWAQQLETFPEDKNFVLWTL